MDKPKSVLIQKPWILLVIALVGWFLGTVAGYAVAYVADSAQNVFDVYADLTILSYLMYATGIIAIFLNLPNMRYGPTRWLPFHLILVGVTIASLWFSHDFRDSQTYRNTGFDDFGERTYALLDYRGSFHIINPHPTRANTHFSGTEIRNDAAAGRWYLDSLESMPEEIMTRRELRLRDQNREFLNNKR